MGRLTNVPAFLPFAWQRSLNGVLMGAIPHALENALGFVFDVADGSDYYARKRSELFGQRHPSKSGAVIAFCNQTSLRVALPQTIFLLMCCVMHPCGLYSLPAMPYGPSDQQNKHQGSHSLVITCLSHKATLVSSFSDQLLVAACP
jgi:hypothetical protein